LRLVFLIAARAAVGLPARPPQQRRSSQFIEVVSCGFAGDELRSLGAGTVFEVKCLFAIDAIAAVYGADQAAAATAGD